MYVPGLRRRRANSVKGAPSPPVDRPLGYLVAVRVIGKREGHVRALGDRARRAADRQRVIRAGDRHRQRGRRAGLVEAVAAVDGDEVVVAAGQRRVLNTKTSGDSKVPAPKSIKAAVAPVPTCS